MTEIDLESDPTTPFTEAVAEARRMIAGAPFIQSEQDLLEGYEYLAGRIRAALMTAFSRYQDRTVLVTGSSQFARLGLDNPDALYFSGVLDGDVHYIVHGRRGTSADLAFQVVDGDYTGTVVPAPIAAFDDRSLTIADDGTFALHLGPGPRPDGVAEGDYVELKPGKPRLIIREVFNDWNTEEPGRIWLERVDKRGEALPPLTRSWIEMQYLIAAKALTMTIEMFLRFPDEHDFRGEPNILTEIRSTPGGLTSQYSVSGRYGLAEDEALVITVPECTDCAYQAIQIGSEWFISTDYETHQSSLTKAQSHVDPDGKIRYVISQRDPGLANWLEAQGHPTGPIFMRWQKTTRELGPDDGAVAEKVKFGDLPNVLPYYTQISNEEYRDRIARRQRAVAARMIA